MVKDRQERSRARSKNLTATNWSLLMTKRQCVQGWHGREARWRGVVKQGSVEYWAANI